MWFNSAEKLPKVGEILVVRMGDKPEVYYASYYEVDGFLVHKPNYNPRVKVQDQWYAFSHRSVTSWCLFEDFTKQTQEPTITKSFDFAGTLKSLRKSRSYTQQTLADLAGITQSYLASLETGTKVPSFQVMQELAYALDVPVKAFFQVAETSTGKLRGYTVSNESTLHHLEDGWEIDTNLSHLKLPDWWELAELKIGNDVTTIVFRLKKQEGESQC